MRRPGVQVKRIMAFNEEESLHRVHRARSKLPGQANVQMTPDDDRGYCSITFLRHVLPRENPPASFPLLFQVDIYP